MPDLQYTHIDRHTQIYIIPHRVDVLYFFVKIISSVMVNYV